ncbi:MAG: hypothetical protein Q8S00_32620 [Deltaproteobacteria bacterium]|nr:hypothetical protein [Deltaproteobacteria bacterium]
MTSIARRGGIDQVLFNDGGVITGPAWASVANKTTAQGDYLNATMSADQLNPAINSAVLFNTVASYRGTGITIDTVTNVGRFTLLAGKTFVVTCALRISDSVSSARVFHLWDLTAGAEVAGSRRRLYNADATSFSGGAGTLSIPVSPTIDSEYEIRSADATVPTIDIIADGSALSIYEIGAVQASVVGGLEFVDSIEVLADVTSVMFGAGGDGAFGRALDGDVDEEYLISYSGPAPGATTNFELRPNGLTTNQYGTRHWYGTTTGITTGSRLYLGQALVATEPLVGRGELLAKSGKNRTWFATQKQYYTSNNRSNDIGGTWTDTTTNITSLEIVATVANAIKAGARFSLWRRTRSNMRSDTAAVYERMSVETVDPGALATTERTVGHSIYGGSVVGISARVEDAVTAGDITVNVKVGGVTKLTAVLDTTNPTSRVVREAIGVASFAADENVTVEFVPTSYDNAGSVPSAVTVQVHLTNNALVTQNDRVVSRAKLSAAATTISLTGLNGDLDEEYEIIGRLILSNASQTVDVAPNGSGANMSTRWSSNGGAATTDAAGQIASLGATSQCVIYPDFRFLVERETGSFRTFSGTCNVIYNSTTTNLFELMGSYLSNTDNLTSLDFISSVASGFLAGSWVEVRRVKA